MPNRLANETSPYLRQHADNPVDWWPWSDAALAPARATGQADPAVDRLQRLPLVPRDGARKLRGRSDRRRDERVVRLYKSGSRGTARHRQDLPARAPGADPARRRLAADRFPHARTIICRSSPARIFRRTRATACRRSSTCCGSARVLGSAPRRRALAERRAGANSSPTYGKATPHADRSTTRRSAAALAQIEQQRSTAEHGGHRGAPKFPHCPEMELLLGCSESRVDGRI